MGGTISGINDGDTVTIQMRDEQVVLDSSSTAFSFYNTPLLLGDTYEVTIAETSLAYSVCTIDANTGTLAADVTDVVVSCEYCKLKQTQKKKLYVRSFLLIFCCEQHFVYKFLRLKPLLFEQKLKMPSGYYFILLSNLYRQWYH